MGVLLLGIPSIITSSAAHASPAPTVENQAEGDREQSRASKMTVYVWDFARRDRGKDADTDKFTREFEAALVSGGKGHYEVLERRELGSLVAQRDNEEAINDILKIPPEARHALQAKQAQIVIFGEVFDDVESGHIKVTVTFQMFSGTKHRIAHILMRRGQVLDAPSREQAMASLVAKVVGPRNAESPRHPRRRVIGLSLTGAGLVTTAVGAGFGITAIRTWNAAFKGTCDRESLECTSMDDFLKTEKARRYARVSDYLIGAGVVAASAGLALYLSSRMSGSAFSGTNVVPTPSPEGLGITVTGRF